MRTFVGRKGEPSPTVWIGTLDSWADLMAAAISTPEF